MSGARFRRSLGAPTAGKLVFLPLVRRRIQTFVIGDNLPNRCFCGRGEVFLPLVRRRIQTFVIGDNLPNRCFCAFPPEVANVILN
jgi:hypothetical protein